MTEPAAERSTSARAPIQVVRSFLGALERFDFDSALALLDERVVYQNVPLPPARGKAAVERQLRFFARVSRSFEVIHHNIAANGAIVLTERTDIIGVGPIRGAFWVCGTFEVEDGRIVLWRDRFDPIDVGWSFVRGAGRALLGRSR